MGGVPPICDFGWKAPDFTLKGTDGAMHSLQEARGPKGTLVVFMCNHCPYVKAVLGPLVRDAAELKRHGVNTIAISSDGEDRARLMADKIGADTLRFGYDLSLAKARDWGLYISTSKGKTSIGIEEPPLFSEPGLFLVSPGQTLYYGSVQTMPFVRPHFAELVKAVDFAIEKDYPARGEYTGAV